jgi:hypothetical protein
MTVEYVTFRDNTFRIGGNPCLRKNLEKTKNFVVCEKKLTDLAIHLQSKSKREPGGRNPFAKNTKSIVSDLSSISAPGFQIMSRLEQAKCLLCIDYLVKEVKKQCWRRGKENLNSEISKLELSVQRKTHLLMEIAIIGPTVDIIECISPQIPHILTNESKEKLRVSVEHYEINLELFKGIFNQHWGPRPLELASSGGAATLRN